MKYIQQSLMTKIILAILIYLDDRIKTTEMKSLKMLGTENRTIVTEAGATDFNRRVYRRADGNRVKSLHQLLGIAPYEHTGNGKRYSSRSTYRSLLYL